MNRDLMDGNKEIFKYRELLKNVVDASMNTPEIYLEKITPIHKDFLDLVDSFNPFTLLEVYEFMENELIKWAQQPYFPVLAGLYINVLIIKLLQNTDRIDFNIEKFCQGVVNDAAQNAPQDLVSEEDADPDSANDVNFSLDFLGFQLPENKTLMIKGYVGEYCGAQMKANSTLILYGMHGKHFTHEKDPAAKVITDVSQA
jgi:hypothetical protein